MILHSKTVLAWSLNSYGRFVRWGGPRRCESRKPDRCDGQSAYHFPGAPERPQCKQIVLDTDEKRGVDVTIPPDPLSFWQ